MSKFTTENFISRARIVHGDKYNYSKSIYATASSKLIIICREHGEFTQTPHGHLGGKGCVKCGGKKVFDTNSFISKAIEVHGERYDYSRSEYKNAKAEILIICKDHGGFYQSAFTHNKGHGCPACSKLKRLTSKEFSDRAALVHCGAYDYKNSIYINSKTKVCITCPLHGEFWQVPGNHLNGQGCPECGNDKKAESQSSTTDDFIKKSIITHGDRYIYTNSVYIRSHKKIEIICKDHGPFMQEPIGHISGRGCPSCAKYGFDKSKNGFVYFLHGDGLIKVGITNKITQRLKQLKSSTPFDFNLIAKVKTTGAEAMRIEKYYHKKYESAGMTGFDGATEWLKYSPELMSEIMNENTTI